jgi:hypothetical protein
MGWECGTREMTNANRDFVAKTEWKRSLGKRRRWDDNIKTILNKIRRLGLEPLTGFCERGN